MFLEKADYYSIIRQDVLDRVIDNNDTNRTLAENTAQAFMESYLRARYNVVAIFSAIGNNRNKLIVRYMIDIALYDLFSRIAPEQMNEVRLQRYQEAVSWLRDVRDGDLSPDLPIVEEEDLTSPKNNFVSSKYSPQDFDF
jgi:phage gp36-like protein